MIRVGTGITNSLEEVTLLAIDDHSIPFRRNLYLTLVPLEKHPDNPLIMRGERPAPDWHRAILYGSVHRIDGRFRMWYLAFRDPLERGNEHRLAYAESEDGVRWVKPKLGLFEYQGNKENNLLLVEPAGADYAQVFQFPCILYEPNDPDPNRRYKMLYHTKSPMKAMFATSADGLCWHCLTEGPPISDAWEPSAVYRFDGTYYVSGQDLSGPYRTAWLADGSPCGRVMVTYRSPDLVNWSSARALSFVRWGYHSMPPGRGEQTHMGAGILNRGNVLVGLYGQMHDDPTAGQSWIGLEARCDLGLIVSNDGIHFREPVPDAIVLQRGYMSATPWDANFLYQGQAFVDVGDRTYFYYSGMGEDFGWVPSGDIGLAMMRRDGFGYLTIKGDNAGLPRTEGHFVTCPMDLEGRSARVYANVADLGPDCTVTVEVLDNQDRPLAGYSGETCIPLQESGIRQPVRWQGRDLLVDPGETVSLRVLLHGDPPHKRPKVYALYVASTM